MQKKIEIDKLKIKKAILSGLPLTITTFTLPREIEVYLEEAISVFLELAGQKKLKDYIVYCVLELAANAKKANTKRVYFNERGLDLTNSKDYMEGMASFKETTLNNISHYLQLQKEKGLYIRIILQIKENIIFFEIRNNVTITRTELIRIHDRLVRSRKYTTLEDALTQILDDSEGAGLGLVILVLMLKKMGLDEDCFDIRSTDKETIARISLPLDQIQLESISLLSNLIADNIKSLPQFPENILEVQRLINDEEAEMSEIAKRMSMDPALTADLLRLVNSAHYMLPKKVDNIFDTVKIIGIRGIKNILYSYGTQKILGADSEEKKKLWEHCNKTAFYAYSLARNFKHDKNLIDDIFVCGILHDMGKIIFSNVHPELLDKIKIICQEKNIPASTFENLSAGLNHAEIGALIAEKWLFPENLIMAIRYHHSPSSAPKEYYKLVECIYLANMFCEYENGAAKYDQFDFTALENYGITSEKQLENLISRFSVDFKKKS